MLILWSLSIIKGTLNMSPNSKTKCQNKWGSLVCKSTRLSARTNSTHIIFKTIGTLDIPTGIFRRPSFIIVLVADRPTGIIRRLTFSQIFYYLHIICTTKVQNTWTILTNHCLNLRATSTPHHAVNATVLIHV